MLCVCVRMLSQPLLLLWIVFVLLLSLVVSNVVVAAGSVALDNRMPQLLIFFGYAEKESEWASFFLRFFGILLCPPPPQKKRRKVEGDVRYVRYNGRSFPPSLNWPLHHTEKKAAR